MKYVGTIPQIDGTRHLYRCPRGTIAIDEIAGRREVTVCLGGEKVTKRDVRDAVRRHGQGPGDRGIGWEHVDR